MDSGKAERPTLPIFVTIGSLVLLVILSALGLSGCQQVGLPASQGLPTVVPGQVLFPVPTATPPAIPTIDPAPPAAVIPTVAPPTAVPPSVPSPLPPPVPSPVPAVTPGTNVIIPDTAPIPSGGPDNSGIAPDQGGFIDDSGVIEPDRNLPEPFPAGPGYGSGVACNRRVVHIVRAGENLFRIALRYNTTTHAIARLNGITNVRAIRPGQRLSIITCRQGGGTPSRGTYVVRPGDNLFRIGLRFGTTAAAIRSVNGLYSNLIVPGQVLRIP